MVGCVKLILHDCISGTRFFLIIQNVLMLISCFFSFFFFQSPCSQPLHQIKNAMTSPDLKAGFCEDVVTLQNLGVRILGKDSPPSQPTMLIFLFLYFLFLFLLLKLDHVFYSYPAKISIHLHKSCSWRWTANQQYAG